jgi:ABC-type lipoprotein export system ATPase subunit
MSAPFSRVSRAATAAAGRLPSPPVNAAVRLQGVGKTVPGGAGETRVLANVSLEVQPGELVAILGVSGSGKSTLLHIIGAMDAATEGRVEVFGRDLSRLGEAERTRFRRNYLGFVFQFYNLLPMMTAVENVAIGIELLGLPRQEVAQRTQACLEAVGLGAKARRYPFQLSGGEQQRVAIARALAKQPLLVLADEPTGNLDRATARAVLALIHELNRESGITFLVVTHDVEVSALADRAYRLGDTGLAPAGLRDSTPVTAVGAGSPEGHT